MVVVVGVVEVVFVVLFVVEVYYGVEGEVVVFVLGVDEVFV